MLELLEQVPTTKSGCLAGFCHYHVMTMSVQTHVYCYPLFENRCDIGETIIDASFDKLILT